MSTAAQLTPFLPATAADLVAGRRGILAADESIPTMNRRLRSVGIAPTEQNRRLFRQLMVTTPGLGNGVSGVTLCDETFRQRLDDGRTFPEALIDSGVQPGIKVDIGTQELAGSPGETVTEGLDGLSDRLAGYASLGARFAKWRAVIGITPTTPSLRALRANAQVLGRYAKACQHAGIVPIVEPEVLMTGDHSMKQCADVTSAVLLLVFRELADADVDPSAMVLKPNMVLPGHRSGEASPPDLVARTTVHALRSVVPDDLAGVAFLSGGMTSQIATANLAAIQRVPAPWPMTFSFGRALVAPALRAWRGEPLRTEHGQQALEAQVHANAVILRGRGAALRIA